MDDSTSIGARVRQAREAAGLTQEAAARVSKVHVQTISRLERGLAKRPEAETLARLARVYGVSTEQLLSGSAEQSSATEGLSTEFLAGVSEGVMWSCQRMSSELTALLADARAQLKLRRWQPPDRETTTPAEAAAVPAGSQAATRSLAEDVAAMRRALARFAPLMDAEADEAQAAGDQAAG